MDKMTTHTSATVGRDARADMAKVIDAIRSIVQSLRISGRAAEQQLGISSAQLYVLQELFEHPAQSINELADRTFTHQSSVSMVVSRLVENRLVTRTSAATDARRLSISLTPAGRAILRKAPDAAQMRLIDGLRTLSRGELHALAANLTSLTDAMGERTSTESEAPVLSQRMTRRA
jgi:DNA-binding MarR family transcriptional regulator